MDGRGGGWGAAVRRVFGDGENPLTWGVSLYRAWGIRVRVHVFFLFFVLAELIRALVQSEAGLFFVAPTLFALFGLVLLHEYGHCVACRRVGGEADEILLWPLGGLASCLPPHRWRAHLWTTVGGPLVNAALLVPLGLVVWLVTGDLGAVVFNPFDPFLSAALISGPNDLVKFGKVLLWSLHYANMVLLAFNVLVPMYPMDGGRILQALLWARLGHRESMRVASIVGLVAAGALAVFAISFSQMTLLAIALLGGFVCFGELRRQKFEALEDPGVLLAPEFEEPSGPSRAEEKRAAREAAEKAEVDRILGKISSAGLESLTKAEKRTLERASAKGRS